MIRFEWGKVAKRREDERETVKSIYGYISNVYFQHEDLAQRSVQTAKHLDTP